LMAVNGASGSSSPESAWPERYSQSGARVQLRISDSIDRTASQGSTTAALDRKERTMGFLSHFPALFRYQNALRVDLAMDLGTANTLIYVKGEGIVVNEPSLVAIDTRTQKTVAVGRAAREFLGRAPAHIRAERPLRDGVIADFDAAMAMIQGLLAKAFRPHFWLNPRIAIGIPSGITQVEKRAVKEAAYRSGGRFIRLVEEPMAAAVGAGVDVGRPMGNMVVDIGGGTTEVAIIALGATAYCESLRMAGHEMDQAIVRYFQRHLHLEIAPTLAEQVKIKLGCALPLPGDPTMTVTGKDVGKGGPRTTEVRASLICEALEQPVDAILDAIRRALENVSAALIEDVKSQGLILTGGGALLSGLDRLIEHMSGIRAHIADDPLTSVVRGCGIAIEDPKKWERIFV
jgi:rod shape-determining protein MreB and related proteins